MSEHGIVYVLTNPIMPGLVKIGKASRDSLMVRLRPFITSREKGAESVIIGE